MSTKKARLLAVAMTGGLVLAGVTAAAVTSTGHAPAHAALAANVAASSAVNLDNCPTLAEGYPAGGCVIQLQTELNAANGTSMPVDGIFGPGTKKAVETFQANHHLAQVDGMVGPQTKAALDNRIPVAAPATTPAQAPSSPSSSQRGTATDSMNLMDAGLPGVRMGSVNLSVYWTWDGSKVTYVANPVVWTSKTEDGVLLEWHTDAPVPVDKDPQNGGFWTREIVVTGTVQSCVPTLDCGPTKPFKLDLYIFGNGVKYVANRTNI